MNVEFPIRGVLVKHGEGTPREVQPKRSASSHEDLSGGVPKGAEVNQSLKVKHPEEARDNPTSKVKPEITVPRQDSKTTASARDVSPPNSKTTTSIRASTFPGLTKSGSVHQENRVLKESETPSNH